MATLRRHIINSMVAAGLVACGTAHMQPSPIAPPATETQTQHQDVLAKLLDRYVDLEGRVDYASWHASSEDSAALVSYTRALLAHPPSVSPERYPTSAARLAYWLNLYNTLAMRAILTHWPVDHVDGKTMLGDRRFDVGGQRMSLGDIEMRIIRLTFSDPRAHFAISCGAMSCPLMPRTLYDGVALDHRLDEAARAFVNRLTNVRVDDDGKRILLSPLLGWYEADFIKATKKRTQHPAPTVVDFLRIYAAPALNAALERAQQGRYRVELLPYDWRINDIASLPLSDKPAAPLEHATGTEAIADLTLELLDGSQVDTRDMRGRVLILDFWATWCRPCLWSFPRYAELLVTHERQGLQVVAIAQDDARAPVDAFAKSNHVAVDIALDPEQSAASHFAITTLPTVLVVDRKGVVRYRLEGYDASQQAQVEDSIRELLEEPFEADTPAGEERLSRVGASQRNR